MKFYTKKQCNEKKDEYNTVKRDFTHPSTRDCDEFKNI